MSQDQVRSRSRTSCCSLAKIQKPPPPPPTFKPPPLPNEEDSIFIRPITRTRSLNPESDSATQLTSTDMPRFLSPQPGSSASSSRNVSPVYKIRPDSFIQETDSKKNPTNEMQGLNVKNLRSAAKNNQTTSSAVEIQRDIKKHNFKNGEQESFELTKDCQRAEKDDFRSVSVKEHSKETPVSNHITEKKAHSYKSSAKSTSKTTGSDKRIEVVEEPFVEMVAYKTTDGPQRTQNKISKETNKRDIPLEKEVVQQKSETNSTEGTRTNLSNPPLNSISKATENTIREEVVEEPFVEVVAYKTTNENNNSLNKFMKKTVKDHIEPEKESLKEMVQQTRIKAVEEPFVKILAYKTTDREKSENKITINSVVPKMTIEPATPPTPPIIHTSKVNKDDDVINPLENSDNDEGYPAEIFPPQVEKQMKKKKKKKLVEIRRVKKEKISDTEDKMSPKQTQNSTTTNEDIPTSRSGSGRSPIKQSRTDKNKPVVSTNYASDEHLATSCNIKTKSQSNNSSDVKNMQFTHQEVNKLEENTRTGTSNILGQFQTGRENYLDSINGNLIEKVEEEKVDKVIKSELSDISGLTLIHKDKTKESNEERIEVIEEPFVEAFAYTTTCNGLEGKKTEVLEKPFVNTSAYTTTEQRIEIVEEPFVETFAYTTTSDQIHNMDAVEDTVDGANNDISLKSDNLSQATMSKPLAKSIESLPFLKTHDNIADLTVETIQDYFSKQKTGKSEERFHTDQKNIIQQLHPEENTQDQTKRKVLSVADSEPKCCKLVEKKSSVPYGDSKIEMKRSTAPPAPPPPPKTPKFSKDNQEMVTQPQSSSKDEASQRRQRQKSVYKSKKEQQIAEIKEFLKGPDGAKQVALPQVRLKQTGKDKDEHSSVLTCLTPSLYLATSRAVADANLAQHGITCIVSTGPLADKSKRDRVVVVSVVVADDEDLPNHFSSVADRLEKERESGGKAVVHSGEVCTHAAMLCMAWLIRHGGKSLEEANQLVMERRPGARPASGLFLRLQEWEKGGAGRKGEGWREVATSWLPLLVYVLVVFVALKFMLGALIKMMGGEKEDVVNSNLYDYFDVYKWP